MCTALLVVCSLWHPCGALRKAACSPQAGRCAPPQCALVLNTVVKTYVFVTLIGGYLNNNEPRKHKVEQEERVNREPFPRGRHEGRHEAEGSYTGIVSSIAKKRV